MNKFYLMLLVFLFSGVLASQAQQQFTYTQFIDNLTAINPAWSLTQDGGAINILGRKQWLNIEGAPSTFMANGYMPIKSINATLGFTFMNDNVAVENLNEFNFFFAKAVKLDDELYLSAAVNGGFRKYKALYSNLDPSDPSLVNSDINESKPNFGAAVMLYSPGKFYAGVSLPRLSYQNLGAGSVAGSGNYKNFYFLTLGYTYQMGEDFKLDNASVIAYTPNVPLEADISSKIWVKNAVGVGFDYRSSNELALLTSFRNDNLSIGYSYMFSFGGTRVAGFSNATHEISIGYFFGNGDGRGSRDTGGGDLRVRK